MRRILTELFRYAAGKHKLDKQLQIAASQSNFELVEGLIRKGANINAFDGAALVSAITSKRLEDAKTLLELNADPNCDGDLCLIWAVGSKTTEPLEILIEAGANLDSERPLRNAIRFGNFDAVVLLVEAGANTKFIDSKIITHLRERGYTKTARYLSQHKSENDRVVNTPSFRPKYS